MGNSNFNFSASFPLKYIKESTFTIIGGNFVFNTAANRWSVKDVQNLYDGVEVMNVTGATISQANPAFAIGLFKDYTERLAELTAQNDLAGRFGDVRIQIAGVLKLGHINYTYSGDRSILLGNLEPTNLRFPDSDGISIGLLTGPAWGWDLTNGSGHRMVTNMLGEGGFEVRIKEATDDEWLRQSMPFDVMINPVLKPCQIIQTAPYGQAYDGITGYTLTKDTTINIPCWIMDVWVGVVSTAKGYFASADNYVLPDFYFYFPKGHEVTSGADIACRFNIPLIGGQASFWNPTLNEDVLVIKKANSSVAKIGTSKASYDAFASANFACPDGKAASNYDFITEIRDLCRAFNDELP